MFSQAPTSQIPLLGSLFSDAVQSSRQWAIERRVEESTTDCLTTFIPEDPIEDISILLPSIWDCSLGLQTNNAESKSGQFKFQARMNTGKLS